MPQNVFGFKEKEHKSFWLISAKWWCTKPSRPRRHRAVDLFGVSFSSQQEQLFLASEVHFPLHAPVTLNNAKPFKFWMEVIPRCSEIIWGFLLPAKCSKMLKKHCIRHEGEPLMLPLGWERACFHVTHRPSKYSRCISVWMNPYVESEKALNNTIHTAAQLQSHI